MVMLLLSILLNLSPLLGKINVTNCNHAGEYALEVCNHHGYDNYSWIFECISPIVVKKTEFWHSKNCSGQRSGKQEDMDGIITYINITQDPYGYKYHCNFDKNCDYIDDYLYFERHSHCRLKNPLLHVAHVIHTCALSLEIANGEAYVMACDGDNLQIEYYEKGNHKCSGNPIEVKTETMDTCEYIPQCSSGHVQKSTRE